MTDNCNADALITARALVADTNCPAHRRAIMAGEWDGGTLVKNKLAEVLKGLAGVEQVDG
jgi:hypothetical protein